MNSPVNLHSIPELKEIQVDKDIVLRPLIQSDAQEIVNILNTDTSIRQKVTVASKFHTPEDVAAEIERYTNDPGLIRYTLLKDNKPIGMVSLWRDEGYFGTPPNLDDYGFGYFIDPKERGRGLVTSAVQSLMDTLIKVITVKRFTAFCTDKNESSIALLTRLGFKPTEDSFPEPVHGWISRRYLKPVGNF